MRKRIAVAACITASLIGVLSAQDGTGDVAQLKAQVSQQQRQIEELSRKLEECTKALEQITRGKASEEPARLGARSPQNASGPLVASTTPMIPAAPVSMAAPVAPAASAQDKPAESSPLQLRVGDAYIT